METGLSAIGDVVHTVVGRQGEVPSPENSTLQSNYVKPLNK
jgi:hypothetical protein